MTALSEFTSVPVVDVAALRDGSPAARERVARELERAAREVGFLYVAGHGVPQRLFDNLLAVTREFFARPLERKMAVYIGRSTNHRGYVPIGEEVFYAGSKDIKEAFDLSIDLPAGDADYVAGNPLLGPNQWPEVEGFREAVDEYYTAALSFGRTLLRGFAAAMGEHPTAFDAFVTKPPSQLRLIHYPFNPAAHDSMGIGAHTDYECFTLLHPTAPGLELLNGAGTWVDVPPIPGTYVVNLGDMMELLTNGEFVATSHRVRRVQEERYSFPLFFSFDYWTTVAPLPRFVSAEKPARAGLVAGEHLFAQTAQSFAYQKQRLARGEIRLPERTLGLSSFGQEALARTVRADTEPR